MGERKSFRSVATTVLGCLCACTIAQAGGDGTCESPILVPYDGDLGTTHVEYDFDTRLWTDNQNSDCVDMLATGPDIVLICDFGCADGRITWEADFDAVVYLRSDTVDPYCDAPCVDSSTTGEIYFLSNYHWEGDDVVCNFNYIIIDGLNGSGGNINLRIDNDSSNPVFDQSWGQVKSRYR